MIRFANTLSGKTEAFVPLEPGVVRLYTCGPTVYDVPHIGNWRAYVFEDLLKRFLIAEGLRTVHVMNITDVDDKTIAGARARGLTLDAFTAPYIEAFHRGRAALNIRPADHYPRATEHIPEMVAIIEGLLEKGFAYRKDGSIYFSIARFPDYGKLSKIRIDDLRPGARIESDEYEKESVHDFALWKAAKDDEPSWETRIGTGRPGWHIECSAMSSKYLGSSFDIHCGGVDNIFPHHENEIAQSEALTGQPFVKCWMHCHHLVVDGEKMSKSKGNFYTLDDLAERGADPLDIRWLLLSTHYRKMLNFTFDALDQARTVRLRLLDYLRNLDRASGRSHPLVPECLPIVETGLQKFREGLRDDLNISNALAGLFEMMRGVNGIEASGRLGAEDAAAARHALLEIDAVLGVLPLAADMDLPQDLSDLIEARELARREKRWGDADAFRRNLLEKGILLEDTKDGVRWKRIPPEKPLS